MTSENEVYETVLKVLELGRSGDMEKFVEAHSEDYTRFSDMPPFSLQHRDLALQLKRSLLAELIDVQYEIRDFDVRLYDDLAIAAYILEYSGVAVSGYTFEGRRLQKTVRCTTVLRRKLGRWVIVHEHLSSIPTQ